MDNVWLFFSCLKSKHFFLFNYVPHLFLLTFFVKVNVNLLFLFPLNTGISWKWTEYLSVLCLKVSIYQLCRKQLTKLANLLMHSQCALSEPISSSRKTRKLTVCRFLLLTNRNLSPITFRLPWWKNIENLTQEQLRNVRLS